MILGLIVTAFFLFGASIFALFGIGGGADEVLLGDDLDVEELAETNPECAAIFEALNDTEDLEPESFETVRCTSEDGEAELSGEVESAAVQASIGAVVAGVLLDGDEVLVDTEEVTVAELEEEEPAATTTTTTEAPPETTTTAAPTTTEAPATTEAAAAVVDEEPFTMWDALNSTGDAVQFAVIGGALGLQEDLEQLEDADGNPIDRTLFAPSNDALAALGPDAIAGLSADPTAAAALVGYHFLEERMLAEDLIAADGETLQTRTQLPLDVTVEGDQVLLNGVSVVVTADLEADNGVVHIIDTVLSPPTLNQVLDLENIEFDVNEATITPAGQDTLALAVEFFTTNATANATIEGHTDTDGEEAANLTLSQARADAVRQFLIDNGIAAERLTAVGFGETQPIVGSDGVEDRDASRRIEFVLN